MDWYGAALFQALLHLLLVGDPQALPSTEVERAVSALLTLASALALVAVAERGTLVPKHLGACRRRIPTA